MPHHRRSYGSKIVKYVPSPAPAAELGYSSSGPKLTADERALLRYGGASSLEIRNLMEAKGMDYYEVVLDPADADEVIVIDGDQSRKVRGDAHR